MKKINILLVLGLFVLLVGMAQPAQAAMLGSWAPSVRSVITSDPGSKPGESFIRGLAQLDAAASKFEGVLNAYSNNKNRNANIANFQTRVDSAASDLSSSLEQFNTALMEVYPTLSEEEQLAVREAYSSLGLYLEDLVVRTNSVFGREVLRIEYGEPFGRSVSVDVFPESPAIDDPNSSP